MDHQPIKWYCIRLSPEDTHSVLSKKLLKQGIDLLDLPHCVYVIRLQNTFVIEYAENKLSPVVYVGEGKLRNRLNTHRKWLAKLQSLLPEAPLEVKFCFPRTEDGSPLNEQYEAHLLMRFKKQFGQLPLRNRKQQLDDGGLTFSKEGRQQALGPGTGKKYIWSIKPLEAKVPFTKFQVQ